MRAVTLISIVYSWSSGSYLIYHLLLDVRWGLVANQIIRRSNSLLEGASLPGWIVVVERCCRDTLHVDAHCLRLLKNAL